MINSGKCEKKQIENFSQKIKECLDGRWTTITKSELESKTPIICGPLVYVVYDNEQIIYVGETRVSLQARFFRNGNSAHYKKFWYSKVTEVKYIQWDVDEMPAMERIIIEQALSLVFNPKYYGYGGRPRSINKKLS